MNVPLTPVRCLYRAVDLYPEKEAVVSGDQRFTYAQFGERCERLAAGLKGLGVAADDRVAYLSFNNHQLLEGYFGIPLMRSVVMPLNVRLTPAELTAILQHAQPRVLFFENDFAPLIAAFRRACPSIEHYLSIDGDYETLLTSARCPRPDLFDFDENAIAELFYTSGSTGNPKGVMLSHRTIYLHALNASATMEQSDRFVYLHTIPLFHANGWGCPQTTTMSGAKHVMVRRFDPLNVLSLIEREKATHMFLVPVMANALLQCADAGASGFDTSSLREIHIGGAAASPEIVKRLEARFGCRVTCGYGLTETAPIATFSRDKVTMPYVSEEDRLERMSMAGWPILGMEARVVDSGGSDVPRDEATVGEVLLRGDNVMDGYYREPDATRAVIEDGWLATGDMAVWNKELVVHIVDRKKDIIISGGENISSIEVERAIARHPAVLECAVIAAPDDKWGEIPVAFAVLRPGERLSCDELLDFVAPHLAKFKHPRRIEFRTEALPKTGTGKILKRELREPFWAGKERRVQGSR